MADLMLLVAPALLVATYVVGPTALHRWRASRLMRHMPGVPFTAQDSLLDEAATAIDLYG